MTIQGQLIQKYLPADYADCFSQSLTSTDLHVDELFDNLFCHFPLPVRWLLKVRDALVKPLGLKTGATFRDRIIERNETEIIVGANDKHLSFWVSVYCSDIAEGKQTAAVSTIVRFNNLLGRIYFAGIWLFHKLIVHHLFTRAIHTNP